MRYRGRFAPSPTGPLHLGSLVAAVGSFLEARRQGGEWLVRIEDIDPPREVPGAADQILRTLERFGLHWDGPVQYQSRRHAAYAAALEVLTDAGAIYACGCSRREIADSALAGPEGPIYPGTCRERLPAARRGRTLRVRTNEDAIIFEDRVQGRVVSRLAREIGDFPVRRADGHYAYQLAVVVDDAAQGITEVVRGADLLGSTARQIHLQRLLGLPTPSYAHMPVVVNEHGDKLSKQTGAGPVDRERPAAVLRRVLEFLGQTVPAEIPEGDLDAFWQWAIANWRPERIPRRRGSSFA